MTPDERQLITGLFDRMQQQGLGDKDREAESLIHDLVRRNPDAVYMMVQSVIVQEMALQNSQAQIDELQARVDDLERDANRANQPSQSSGSFLGGLFGGGGSRPSTPASVPSTGRPAASFTGGAARSPGSPWGNAASANAGGASGQQGAVSGRPGPNPQQAAAPAGGGFMRSAMTTAAGVAGGMLAANAISSMLSGHGSTPGAQTAAAPTATPTTNEPASTSPEQVAGADETGADDFDNGDDAGVYDSSFDDDGDWGSDLEL